VLRFGVGRHWLGARSFQAIGALQADNHTCSNSTNVTWSGLTTTTTTPEGTADKAAGDCGKDDVNIMLMWVFSSVNLVIDIVNIALFGIQ
jgi:hypothetical protein